MLLACRDDFSFLASEFANALYFHRNRRQTQEVSFVMASIGSEAGRETKMFNFFYYIYIQIQTLNVF